MRKILFWMILGGLSIGIVWGVVYYFILILSGIKTSIIHALLYGAIIGALLGVPNSIILLIAGGKEPSRKIIILSTSVMIIVGFFVAVLFSPSLFHLSVNVLAAALGLICLNTWVLDSISK